VTSSFGVRGNLKILEESQQALEVPGIFINLSFTDDAHQILKKLLRRWYQFIERRSWARWVKILGFWVQIAKCRRSSWML